MNYALIICGVLIGGLLGGSANGHDDPYQHAVELLSKHPLIDGYYVSRESLYIRIIINFIVVVIFPLLGPLLRHR